MSLNCEAYNIYRERINKIPLLSSSCYLCNRVGHLAKDCRYKPELKSIKCCRCERLGHNIANCIFDKSGAIVKCYICTEPGHRAIECKKFGDVNMCYRCGLSGHPVNKCSIPSSKPAQTQNDTPQMGMSSANLSKVITHALTQIISINK